MEIGQRFKGTDGARLLREALARQEVVHGDEEIADALASVVKVRSVPSGQQLIGEGGTDTDIYFVLLGSVQILRGGRAGPVRSAGECIGEMATLDIQAKRAATAVTREDTVVAQASRADFSKIADVRPALWRRLAITVAERLTQRLKDVIPRNEIPRVFIGSSTEGLPVAKAIQAGMSFEKVEVRIWTDGIFEASATTIEALEQAVRESDFALLIMSPDDETKSRGTVSPVPRDNVVLELGLFMGALGRHRTYSVVPRGLTQKVPSDLLGVTPLIYDPNEKIALESRIAPVCAALRARIAQHGAK